MAPTDELFTRDSFCSSGYYWDGRYCQRRSGWHFWGRWVLAGIALFIGLIFFLACLCVARKKRKAGAPPIHGTGWMGGGHKPNNTNGHEMNNQQAGYGQGGYGQGGYDQGGYNQGGGYGGGYSNPPPYGQAMNNQGTGATFNPNDGYYTGQQYGVQQPPNTYQPEAQYPPAPK